MARYIDADVLYKDTEKRIKEANSYRMAVVDDEFLDLINDAFTEDVVPRETIEQIFEEIQKEIVAALESNGRVYTEHLKKYRDKPNLEFLCICNAKTNALRGIEGFIEELKKKYIGEQNDDR